MDTFLWDNYIVRNWRAEKCSFFVGDFMKKNKQKETYCSYEYFMKHKCNGCKLGRECEEWNAKMDSSNNVRVSTISISNDTDKHKVQKNTKQIWEKKEEVR